MGVVELIEDDEAGVDGVGQTVQFDVDGVGVATGVVGRLKKRDLVLALQIVPCH